MVSLERTIDTPLLKAFVATARSGSVTVAAESLGLVKSAVSKHLASLEALLQVKLFERGGRRIALTIEGERLLPRAESILADLDRFVVDAQSHATQVRGTVRIAASPEFGTFLTAHFLPDVLRRHEALRIAMSIEYRFDDLQDPGVDLAFRLGSMPDDRLVGRHLGDMARVLVCSTAYAKSLTLETPAHLARANALQFPDNDFDGEWTLHGTHDPGEIEKVETQGTFAVRSFEALAAAAAAGLGVARVPRFVAAARLADGSLVEPLHGWRPPPIPVYLAYRSGVTRIGRVRAVLDAAMTLIPPMLVDSNT